MSSLTPTNSLTPFAARPSLSRRGSSGNSLQFPMEISAGPTPPSLISRGLLPPVRSESVEAITYALDGYRMTPSPDPRHADRLAKTPSPLPPPLEQPLPSELESMSLRLTALVQQSNAYVAGLKSRLDAIEDFRSSWSGPATRDELTTFLHDQADFGTLDIDRLLTFGLPLTLWQRITQQVLHDYASRPNNLPSILYWRARVEAEVLGYLHSDRRSSASSTHTPETAPESRRPSAASVLSVASVFGQRASPEPDSTPSSRRPSLPTNSYMGPRRSSSNPGDREIVPIPK